MFPTRRKWVAGRNWQTWDILTEGGRLPQFPQLEGLREGSCASLRDPQFGCWG